MNTSGFSMGGQITGTMAGPKPSQATGDIIVDSDTQNFAKDVIEASKNMPVIVDFWAPWCGPCKQLTPILEKVVKEAKGQIRLAKINVDQNQALAGQLRVQSIPAVFAFVNGQPVDGFMGALAESQIKDFVDRLLEANGGQPQLDDFIASAKQAMEAGELQQAGALFSEILRQDPENCAAIAGIAKIQIAVDDLEAAALTLEQTPEGKEADSEISSARAALELASTPSNSSEIEALKSQLQKNPDDHQAAFDLALALNASGQHEEAIELLIGIIKANREWNEEAARKQLLTFFEAWGATDKKSITGRRKLSAVLFS